MDREEQAPLFRVYLNEEYKKLYEAAVAERKGHYSTLLIRQIRGHDDAHIELGLPDDLENVTTLEAANLIAYFATKGKTLDDILGNLQWGIQDTPENIRKRAEPELENVLGGIVIRHELDNLMLELGPLITKYGEPAVELIYEWIQKQRISEEAAAGAVVVIAQSNWPSTAAYRISFLTRCLEAPYAEVRRAAAGNLSIECAGKCIPVLQKAHEKETEGWVKDSIAGIIASLQKNGH